MYRKKHRGAKNPSTPLKSSADHKEAKFGWTAMDPLTAAFGLACIGVGGGAGFWLKKADARLQRLSETAVVLQEGQAAHFSHLNTEVNTLQQRFSHMTGLVEALRATHPEIDGALLVHSVIVQYENSTEMEQEVSRSDALEALETLISPLSTESEIGGESLLSSATESLLNRLLDVFHSRKITVEALGLNPVAAHRLGHASLLLRRYDWAESCFGVAYRSSPGNQNILEALEHIALLRGDEELRRHWLEARMTVTPDQPELLRAHAHLLAKLGDAEAERDIRRLEALGVDTAADRSLLSGLRARAGSRSEALEAIELALADDPQRSDDWYSYAHLLYDDGEQGKAQQAVERCLDLDRQNGEAWGLLAKLLAPMANRLEEALKAAVHAVALEAGGTQLVFLKSDLLLASGKVTESEEALERALLVSPDNAELRARMASRKLLNGYISEAQKILDETPLGIDHPLLHVIEGRLHLARADRERDGTGQTDASLLAEALAAFNDGLRLDRESGVAWLGLARTKRLLGDLEGAEEDIGRALRLLPDQDPSSTSEAALLALDLGDISAATKHIEAAAIHGNSATIHYVRGNIAARTGILDKALMQFDEALSADPAHIRARLNRCSILMAMGEGRKVVDDAEILLDLAPLLTLARLRRAEGFMLLSEWENARDDLKMVLEKAPHHYHALTQLGSCYLSLERPERAEGPLNEAIRLNQNHAPAWHQRGLLYLELKEIDAAYDDFQAAIRCDANHLDARLHVAATLHQQERHEEAAAAWRAVLTIDPDHTVARTRLGECEVILL
ncbi:MAG: tetratricopeptide (TPR) repeat protein [Candidatus Poseidoniaceae archaeon]|jgi:tetratricopeptide (TPR) repeat protein